MEQQSTTYLRNDERHRSSDTNTRLFSNNEDISAVTIHSIKHIFFSNESIKLVKFYF
jgi:hypothetical protein